MSGMLVVPEPDILWRRPRLAYGDQAVSGTNASTYNFGTINFPAAAGDGETRHIFLVLASAVSAGSGLVTAVSVAGVDVLANLAYEFNGAGVDEHTIRIYHLLNAAATSGAVSATFDNTQARAAAAILGGYNLHSPIPVTSDTAGGVGNLTANLAKPSFPGVMFGCVQARSTTNRNWTWSANMSEQWDAVVENGNTTWSGAIGEPDSFDTQQIVSTINSNATVNNRLIAVGWR